MEPAIIHHDFMYSLYCQSCCTGESAAQHSEVAATAQNSSYRQAGQRLQGKLAVLYCFAGCLFVARNDRPTCIALYMQRDKQGAKPPKQQAAQMVSSGHVYHVYVTTMPVTSNIC